MIPLGSLPPAPLRLALRAAAACAAAEPDPVLRELGAALRRLAGEPGEAGGRGASAELQLRERVLCLGERCAELRLRVQAAACLQHAEPARARRAQALLALPWPEPSSLSEEETLVPGALDCGAVGAQLAQAAALLSALDSMDARGALAALELAPLRGRLSVLHGEAAGLTSRHRADASAGAGRGWQAEALDLLARYRAYAVVATGKLSAGGEDLGRRERLLAPFSPAASLWPLGSIQ
jgi:hypothetical protein